MKAMEADRQDEMGKRPFINADEGRDNLRGLSYGKVVKVRQCSWGKWMMALKAEVGTRKVWENSGERLGEIKIDSAQKNS